MLEKEENEILQRNIEENSNNIVQNHEQVAASGIASVMKTSTFSCSSGKISSNIEEKQQQWQ